MAIAHQIESRVAIQSWYQSHFDTQFTALCLAVVYSATCESAGEDDAERGGGEAIVEFKQEKLLSESEDEEVTSLVREDIELRESDEFRQKLSKITVDGFGMPQLRGYQLILLSYMRLFG